MIWRFQQSKMEQAVMIIGVHERPHAACRTQVVTPASSIQLFRRNSRVIQPPFKGGEWLLAAAQLQENPCEDFCRSQISVQKQLNTQVFFHPVSWRIEHFDRNGQVLKRIDPL